MLQLLVELLVDLFKLVDTMLEMVDLLIVDLPALLQHLASL